MAVFHIENRQTTLDPTDFHCMKTLRIFQIQTIFCVSQKKESQYVNDVNCCVNS